MSGQTTKKLINDPDRLIADLVEGMLSAHPQLLTTEGETGRAIVAVNGPRDGKVGIVIGGGSGHEPAFAGYVGRGLADAAPLGNIFASPSPAQIFDAGFAADGGAGVLFLYGNYTGDVMNFTMAEEQLAEEGIKARSFVVTDDVASAPPDRADERRGIAGDFFVFKVAGAAADLGLSLDEVEEAARRANAATLTFGVALSACSMPQTGKANFYIPPDEMEIGMGIHGEPGIERTEVGTADEVTERLMQPIVDELSLVKGDEVAVLVNGLGSTTLLELYLLHRRVAQMLAAKEVRIHYSWVGEYCTSLEMAGASITLMKLDGDLKRWLDHPCDTPALRVGEAAQPPIGSTRTRRKRLSKAGDATVSPTTLKEDGSLTPVLFRSMLAAAGEAVIAERDRLCALDGAIGDGDHGITMQIGWNAVLGELAKAEESETVSATCIGVSQAFLDAVGASSGPLYACGFEAAGKAVADRRNLDAKAVVAWLAAMAEGIRRRGGAELGDKTMLDAWLPAAEAASRSLEGGGDISDCLKAASLAATSGAEKTTGLQSRRGRSKKLGARSVGHIDPGAVSAALFVAALSDACEQAAI